MHSTSVSPYRQPAGTANFSLSAPSSSLFMNPASTRTSTITITPSGGFTGQMTLGTSGLPSGVGASFNHNPATSSSTLTFVASSNSSQGTFTVTVSGTSGSLTHTPSIRLTVGRRR
jgi:pseudomonalisin